MGVDGRAPGAAMSSVAADARRAGVALGPELALVLLAGLRGWGGSVQIEDGASVFPSQAGVEVPPAVLSELESSGETAQEALIRLYLPAVDTVPEGFATSHQPSPYRVVVPSHRRRRNVFMTEKLIPRIARHKLHKFRN